MAMNYFAINGVKSTDVGIVVKELPPPVLAAPRMAFQEIPGMDGSLTILERDEEDGLVYSDYTVTALCYMKDLTRLNEAAAFLARSGDIYVPNRPGGHYRGRITGQVPIEQIMKGRPQREFEVMFRMHPFWYADDVSNITLTAAGNVANPGNVHSEPIITVTGNGNIILYVHDYAVFITGLSGSVTLDCSLKLAYSGTALKNGIVKMETAWPRLKPGGNYITWSGNVSKVVIEPRWRYR